MSNLRRRLDRFMVDLDALTIEEVEADYRIVLRAVRDEHERRGGEDPTLLVIREILEIEGDGEALQCADEALLDAWAARHGYAPQDVARNREQRAERTRAWLERLERHGELPRIEEFARDFWAALAW